MSAERVSGRDAARSRFLTFQAVMMVLFGLSLTVGEILTSAAGRGNARVVGTALAAAILVVWAIAFARMIRGEDEMMHLLHLRAVAIGAGLVLFVASLWGLFEHVLDAPGLPGYLLLPAFAVAYSIVLFIQGGRRR